jgi:hypothetical protein
MNKRSFLFGLSLLLVALIALAGPARAGTPNCSTIFSSGLGLVSCWFQMPNYDQTNPNLAAYLSPTTFVAEPNTVNNPPVSNFLCGINNPFDLSWLPYGPFPGDANSLWTPSCWYTFSELCCPTAEAMALTAAIASKSPSTTYSGWTSMFESGQPISAPASGLTNQTGPIFPFVTDPRQHMQVTDVQRVIDMALAQGTMPNAGGYEGYITTLGGDFTPVAVGANGDPNTVSNTNFISDIEAGTVIVIAIHTYTATVSGSSVTFTFVPSGHCLAVEGFTTIPILGPPNNRLFHVLEIINPWFGGEQLVGIVNLRNGTYTKAGQTRTLTLPNSNWTSAGIWPDSANPVSSVWDIANGQQITFIDEFHTLNVP